MNIISSGQNSIIKKVKALKEKKNREEQKQFFIEGLRFVEEALKEGVQISFVLVSEKLHYSKNATYILEQLKNARLATYTITDKLFNEVSDTDNPQGIMAVIEMKSLSVEEVLKKGSFFIILDSIQDPGNMGTIIRTADAAGVDGIIASKGCVDIYNPKVLRSTMGSIFHVPACSVDNLYTEIDMLKAKGVKILAAHLDGRSNYFEQDMKGALAIIIGNEANGISDEAAGRADFLVKIPMPGKAESLNASVAAGLLMYEAVRQRSYKK